MKCDKKLHLAHAANQHGFTLIEIMIAMLCLGALGLGMTNYLRKNSRTMSNVDATADVQSTAAEVQKLFSKDIRQVAYIHPGCGGAPTGSTAACNTIPVKGGIVPIPGKNKTQVDALTNTLGVPSNISDTTSSLSVVSDAMRLALFDFTTPINCKLNHFRATNPSTTAGNGAGAERMWALRSGCTGNLVVGGLYVLMESIGTAPAVVYANVFQITAMTDLAGPATGPDQLQIDAASTSIFNQTGGLGLSGFSASARIYPIKLVEWAHESTNLYRREIKPISTSANGYGSWNLLSENVEGLQFYPITVTTTSIVEHQRTMQFTADTDNNDVDDIRGVSPRIVIKSTRTSSDTALYDNPMTAEVENDHYPRQEMKFYIDVQNTHTN
jgi:prepilin-type N-terminal cleavage/methylation domain-containing protein